MKRVLTSLVALSLSVTLSEALGRASPPLAPLAPYLPPEPSQGFLWAGTVKFTLKYEGKFPKDNYTEKFMGGYSTREKRGSEDLQLTLTLHEAELAKCAGKCDPAVGTLKYTTYLLERFISESEVLCQNNQGGQNNQRVKQVHISTQERFSLAADGQQGTVVLKLLSSQLRPVVDWNAGQQTWALTTSWQPLFTKVRFYDKTEDMDCAGSHPSAPTQQLLDYPIPLPVLVPLKKQTMTFKNTLSGTTNVPVMGLDGVMHNVTVTYDLHLIPLSK